MTGPLLLLCVALWGIPYLIQDAETAWFVGWASKDLAISILSATICCNPILSIQTRTAALIFSIVSFMDFSMQLFGLDYDSLGTVSIFIVLFSGMSLFVLKQLLLVEVDSDKLNKSNYMYLLFNGSMEVVNSIRPLTFTPHGGRAVVAGDKVYCAHRGKFIKVRTKDLDLSKYTIIDSGMPINENTNMTLENILNKRYIVILRDCSRLYCGTSLNSIIIKRLWGRVYKRFFT